jgi:thiosulfate/3-mercaptopyruvate sulfurtransferase
MMICHPKLSRLALAAVLVTAVAACGGDNSGSASSTEPWGANTVKPADLVGELASASGADKPVVVCTAPPFLYRVGHIPGAVFHGPASSPSAIDELTAWAQTLPRTTNLVIYCGCCPLAQCPNLRPAYKALKDLGFTRLRVLILPENFATDWVDRGYPVEK